MMKKALLIFVVSLGVLFTKQSYADFEGVETVLTQLEKVQKKAEVVQEKYKKIEAAINSVRQGEFGPIADLAKEYNIDKVATKQFNKLSGITNPADMQSAIETETIPNYTNENQTETYNEAQEINNAILREDLSRLYAYAFTLRTNMAKENKERDDEAKQTDDAREMLKLANEEAEESAQRMNRIVDMISSRYELDLRMVLKSLSVDVEEDEEGDAE